VDRKRKLPVTILLRALGYGSDEELLALFADDDNNPEHPFILSTIEKEDPNKRTPDEAVIDFYRRLRPVDPPTLENARNHLERLLFDPRRYDLGKVGRYKLNRRLKVDMPLEHRLLTKEDIIEVIRHIIRINNGVEDPDDIDHLGNRRVKTVGELLQNQLRVGLLRMERTVRERMSIRDADQVSPLSLINIRPVVAAVREFFGGSQLSQFMDQTNPLSELTNKRRLSALGPGGLRREARVSRCATCTIPTMVVSAPSRRPKARTSVLSGRWRHTPASMSSVSSRRPTARSSTRSKTIPKRASAMCWIRM